MHLTDDMRGKYGYFRDVNIMIFFGFGMLMTFLRRYGYAENATELILEAALKHELLP